MVIQKILQVIKYFQKAGIDMNYGASIEKFSAKKLYIKFIGQFPEVHWKKLVCNNRAIKMDFVKVKRFHN